jgi:predicted AAA+ superfamily ATPase
MFHRLILDELNQWRNSQWRKPLIIRGARQVGKTTVIHEFGKQFKQYIYLNLENSKDVSLFRNEYDIHDLVTRIFLEKKRNLQKINETLLFIDEIQEMPEMLNRLRYFKEELPELCVIYAGSMLENLMGKSLHFPVGRVEFKVLRPFNFEEYLLAMDYDDLQAAFLEVPLPTYVQDSLFVAFHSYAIVGGMPEVIKVFQSSRDLTALKKIYDGLIQSYFHDAERYVKNDQQLQLIKYAIPQSMKTAGMRSSFQKFGQNNYTSKAIAEVLRDLEKTHLVQMIYPTTSTTIPIIQDNQKTPRFHFLDTGMVNHFLGVQKDLLGSIKMQQEYQGRMIEHWVGQELLSIQTLSLSQLNFWVRNKKQSEAELDYVLNYNGHLIPIEVKSGPTGKLKSLHQFMDLSPIQLAVRFYDGRISIDDVTTPNGKSFVLLNLPYFLASKIEAYLSWILTSKGQHLLSNNSVMSEAKKIYHVHKLKKQKEIELNSKHFLILKACESGPKTGRELIENVLGLTYQSNNKRTYLAPLIERNLLRYTDTNNLKNKEQRYQLT